jgi:hypothetical protein
MKHVSQGSAGWSPGLILIAFLPPLLLAVLIIQCWANVPFWDDWDTPGLLLREYFSEGRFSWRQLFAQHNESRMVVPKLAAWAAALFTGEWDTRIPMALMWTTAVGIFVQFVWLLHKTVRASAASRWCLAAALSAVLFSTNQWENWLWSLQLAVFLPPLCLASCLVVQHCPLAYRTKVIACALLSLISTFSNSNGMLCWILGAPLPWVSHPELKSKPTKSATPGTASLAWMAIYVFGLIATIAVYFWGYSPPAAHPSLGFAFKHPVAAAQYFIVWLGSPFCRGIGFDPLKSAFALGLLVIAALVFFLFAVWRRRQWIKSGHGWIQLHPWTMLTVYGLASGVITALGRAGFGIDQAISVRYISFSSYVYLGLIGLIASLPRAEDGWAPRPRLLRLAGTAVVGLFFVIFVANWLDGSRAFRWRRVETEKMKLAICFLPLIPANPALSRIYPDPDRLRQIAFPLIERNILRPGIVGPWPLQKLQQADGDDLGWFTVKRGPAGFEISGWSIVSDRTFSPTCVLLITVNAEKVQQLATATRLSSPVRASGAGYLRVSGFAVDLPSAHPQTTELKLYSADLKHHRLFRLIERAPTVESD